MIYLANSGTTSIESFQSNDNQRMKGRKFFGFKNGAYISNLKYEPNKVPQRSAIMSTQKKRQPSFDLLLTEVVQMYLAGTISFLAVSGLISLIF